MSLELERELPLEIAHVLFMDVVSYSKLLVNEQSEVQQQLNRIVLRWEWDPIRKDLRFQKLLAAPEQEPLYQ
jgi:hypothetical protein